MSDAADDTIIEEAQAMAAAMVQAAKAHPCKHNAALVMLTACIMLTETVVETMPGEADSVGRALVLFAAKLLTGKMP